MAAPKKAEPLPVAASFDVISAAEDIGEKTVEIEAWGCAVKIRGLTRGEVKHMAKDEVTAEAADVFALVTAVLEPKLTEEQATKLLTEKSVGAVDVLMNAILNESGLGAGFRAGDTG